MGGRELKFPGSGPLADHIPHREQGHETIVLAEDMHVAAGLVASILHRRAQLSVASSPDLAAGVTLQAAPCVRSWQGGLRWRSLPAHLLFPPSATVLCSARSVDRLREAEHAGLRSTSTSLPCSMDVRPCLSHPRPLATSALTPSSKTQKLAAILVSDVVGFSRLAGADEDRILARLRALRSDLIDPVISVHHGRVVKRTGDGVLVEFRSVVDAVRCAIEVQNGLVERNAGLPPERRIEFRVGIHLGDVVEESDGDLMGDERRQLSPHALRALPSRAASASPRTHTAKMRDKLKEEFIDLGEKELKNIPRPIRVYALESAPERFATEASTRGSRSPPPLSIVVLPFANLGGDPEQDYFVDSGESVTESLTTDLSRIGGSVVIGRHTAFTYKGKAIDLKQIGRELNVRYVLEGSVQRGGNRLRINAQLIDAETGNHIWAERFDKAGRRPSGDAGRDRRTFGAPTRRRTDRSRGPAGGTGTGPKFKGPLLSRLGLVQQGPCTKQRDAGASLFRARFGDRPGQC